MLTSDTLEVLIDAGVDGHDLLVCARSLEQADNLAMVFGIFAEEGVERKEIIRFFNAMTGPRNERLPDKEWQALRLQVFERDYYCCNYCDATEGRLCPDHVIPLSRGGTNELHNLASCCLTCNNSKNDRLPGEWMGRSR